MSFYDQYQADDLGCKVYCGPVDTESIKSENDTRHSASVATSVIELKSTPSHVSAPDVSSIHVSGGHASPSSSANTWNLPDLLIGLDGITTRSSSDSDSPPLSSSSHLLTSSIPCISLPNLDLTDHHDPGTSPGHPGSQQQSSSSYYFDSFPSAPSRGLVGPGDSLLEGLGILSPSQAGVSSVKTEMVSCPSPQQQYNMTVDSRVESPISMDLSQLVSQHNIPAQFELSIQPKCDPSHGLQPSNTNSIPISTFSLSNITNIASVSIANIDLLTKTSPLSLDLIAQHCTLLPPELVSLPPVTSLAQLSPSTTTYITHDQDQDLVNNNIQDTVDTIITPVHIKEEDEGMSPIHTGDVNCPMPAVTTVQQHPITADNPGFKQLPADNPSYKRCHLCVRIFSTKANLSSHIRHVHLGEAKHSRVKSIPCPHCNKMFSRKGHMTEHVRTVHEGKKRIYKEVNCQHCGKTFRRKWGLNIHISSAHADVISSLVKQ